MCRLSKVYSCVVMRVPRVPFLTNQMACELSFVDGHTETIPDQLGSLEVGGMYQRRRCILWGACAKGEGVQAWKT